MIERITAGGKSLIYADKANELIDPMNQFLAMKLIPDGAGTVTIADAGATIDLTPTIDRISALEDGASDVAPTVAIFAEYDPSTDTISAKKGSFIITDISDYAG